MNPKAKSFVPTHSVKTNANTSIMWNDDELDLSYFANNTVVLQMKKTSQIEQQLKETAMSCVDFVLHDYDTKCFFEILFGEN